MAYFWWIKRPKTPAEIVLCYFYLSVKSVMSALIFPETSQKKPITCEQFSLLLSIKWRILIGFLAFGIRTFVHVAFVLPMVTLSNLLVSSIPLNKFVLLDWLHVFEEPRLTKKNKPNSPIFCTPHTMLWFNFLLIKYSPVLVHFS